MGDTWLLHLKKAALYDEIYDNDVVN